MPTPTAARPGRLRTTRSARGAVAAAAAAAALLLGGAAHPADPPKAVVAPMPGLMVMTGLPIVWGEKGAFDPSSRPAQAYRQLSAEFTIRLLDTIEPESLAGGRLLLLAQPHWLRPSELAAVDAWVRRGGKALILADPTLAWPSELPLGDIRRPPPESLLGPLTSHWGLKLDAAGDGAAPAEVDGRRLIMEAPGRWTSATDQCAVGPEWLARCRIGRGEAVLVADADLMRDELWLGHRGDLARRAADNPAVLADWLDGLIGLRRDRALPARSRRGFLPLAVAAILLLSLAGLLLARRRRA